MALDAARSIIDEKGPDGLTARAVAARIGYSVGTLYNLFTNIDELVLQLNQETLQRLGAEAEAALAAERDPFHRLLALGDTYLRFALSNKPRWITLFDDRPINSGVQVPEWYEDAAEGVLGIVERELTSLFPSDHDHCARMGARVLWAGVHGISSLAVTGRLDVGYTLSAEDMIRMLIRNYLAGALGCDPAAGLPSR